MLHTFDIPFLRENGAVTMLTHYNERGQLASCYFLDAQAREVCHYFPDMRDFRVRCGQPPYNADMAGREHYHPFSGYRVSDISHIHDEA